MKTKFFTLIGAVCLILPIYAFIGWINVWNVTKELSHHEKVIVYHERIWLNVVNDSTYSTLILVAFGVISMAFLFLAMLPELKIVGGKKTPLFTFQVLFFAVACLFTGWYFWSMM
ncbi:MAG: hypothetical protein ACLGGV_03825 [Bacteroidia bacterium]